MGRLTYATFTMSVVFILGCMAGDAAEEDPRGDWTGLCYLDDVEFDLELRIGGTRTALEGGAILSQPDGVRYPGELAFGEVAVEDGFDATYEVEVNGTRFLIGLSGYVYGDDMDGSCFLEWDEDRASGQLIAVR